jgi:uncharacterized membrane protein
MEPEVSLLCSQHPATGPYSKPDAASPHPKIHSKIIFPLFGTISKVFFIVITRLLQIFQMPNLKRNLVFYSGKYGVFIFIITSLRMLHLLVLRSVCSDRNVDPSFWKPSNSSCRLILLLLATAIVFRSDTPFSVKTCKD